MQDTPFFGTTVSNLYTELIQSFNVAFVGEFDKEKVKIEVKGSDEMGAGYGCKYPHTYINVKFSLENCSLFNSLTNNNVYCLYYLCDFSSKSRLEISTEAKKELHEEIRKKVEQQLLSCKHKKEEYVEDRLIRKEYKLSFSKIENHIFPVLHWIQRYLACHGYLPFYLFVS